MKARTKMPMHAELVVPEQRKEKARALKIGRDAGRPHRKDETLLAVPYTIEQHQHLYAAWAASRGASVTGCRFKVEQGRQMLEACGFGPDFSDPNQLPTPEKVDEHHRLWRASAIKSAKRHSLTVTHGVAAKLINLYLKCRFVCGGHHDHPHVRKLHPPIDSVMLKAFIQCDVGGLIFEWRRLQNRRWSKFSSAEYEEAVDLIRQSLMGEPLWKIEEYWQGNQ